MLYRNNNTLTKISNINSNVNNTKIYYKTSDYTIDDDANTIIFTIKQDITCTIPNISNNFKDRIITIINSSNNIIMLI